MIPIDLIKLFVCLWVTVKCDFLSLLMVMVMKQNKKKIKMSSPTNQRRLHHDHDHSRLLLTPLHTRTLNTLMMITILFFFLIVLQDWFIWYGVCVCVSVNDNKIPYIYIAGHCPSIYLSIIKIMWMNKKMILAIICVVVVW